MKVPISLKVKKIIKEGSGGELVKETRSAISNKVIKVGKQRFILKLLTVI